MTWIQISFASDPAGAAALEEALLAAGAGAVTLRDCADQPLYEPPPGATPLWTATSVTGLFPASTDSAAVVRQVGTALGSEPPAPKIEILEDKDWEREWMRHYQPLRCGERLWICPSWRAPPDPAAVNLLLDPGLAFGTGTHPTTYLCLAWLDAEDLAGKTVLDFGCGSGILAIAALLLGAERAWAVDIDPQALEATRANAARNGVPSNRIITGTPDALPADLQVDVVVANILAGPLVELAPALKAACRPGAALALSGILAEQASSVSAAYSGAFNLTAPVEREGWVRLTGRRAGKP